MKFAPGAGIDIRGDATGGGIAKLVAAGTSPPGDYSPVVFQNADNTLAPAWGRLRGLNKNSIIDLRSGVGFDLPVPGSGIAIAGDTLVILRLLRIGGRDRTEVSVLHPSQLSPLRSCASA